MKHFYLHMVLVLLLMLCWMARSITLGGYYIFQAVKSTVCNNISFCLVEFADNSPLHLILKKVEGGLREHVELFMEKCGLITHTSAFYEILLHCDLRKGYFMDTLFSSKLRKSHRKVFEKNISCPYNSNLLLICFEGPLKL